MPSKPPLFSCDVCHFLFLSSLGPGSSDSSEESGSPHEGAALHANEDSADSASEDLYEDTRSLTPHPRDLPTSNSVNQRSTPVDSATMSELPVNPELDHVADLNSPLPALLQMTSKDNMHSNSDENVQDSNETSDTDFRESFRDGQWKSRKFESDFSTAPFSSETSDMDTSGNERFLTADNRLNRIGPSKEGNSPHVEHRQLNSESSGDEVAKRARDVKIIPRPPPKPVVLQSGPANKTGQSTLKAPPTAKKPAHLLKNSPVTGKSTSPAVSMPTKTTSTPVRNRGSVKGLIPSKPKPPVAVKPKPEVKPRQAASPSQPRTSTSSNSSGSVVMNGRPAVNGEDVKTKPVLSPRPLRKNPSDIDLKKPVVATRPQRVSEPQSRNRIPERPPPPVKPVVSPKPEKDRPKLTQDPQPNPLSPTPPSAGSEDTSKNSSSSSETLSSQSPYNSPFISPAIKKKPLPQNKMNTSNILPSKLDHSHSSPILPTRFTPAPAKELDGPEVVMKTRAQPTSNNSSPTLMDRSQSVPAASLTNGIQSPSPPPIPPRVRESQVLDVPSVKDRRTSSPIMGRSNRRPPPEPPRNPSPVPHPCQQRSPDIDDPPPVPPHGGKRLGSYSKTLSLTQIHAIQQNYEVCDIDEEESASQSNTSASTHDRANKDSSGDVPAHSRLKKKMSTTRRTPPRPPAEESHYETSETVSPSVPVRNRPHSHSVESEHRIPKAHSSPILGDRSKCRSSPGSILTSVQELTKAEPPKRVYQRARRDYEEIDIIQDDGRFDDSSAVPLPLEKPVYKNIPIRKPVPLRRNYEEIDIVDELPTELHSDSSAQNPSSTNTTPTERETPVSPIMMVAVTKQTSSSTMKFNSNQIPTLPVEDLRENWAKQSTSPPLPRRQAKSFSAKRGRSLVCRRSSSDRFMVSKVKVTTLDPKLVRNVSQRCMSVIYTYMWGRGLVLWTLILHGDWVQG